MIKKIVENVYSFIFSKQNSWFFSRLWRFWNKKIKPPLLFFRKRRKKTAIEIMANQYTVEMIFSKAENETQLLLLESLVAIYGKMYLKMNLLCGSNLELRPLIPDDVILERLWRLQALCQIGELEDKKSTILFYQVSLRDHIVRLREFIEDGEATFLDLKAGTGTIREICTIMNVPSYLCDLVSDVASEELVRINDGRIKSTLTDEEVKNIWKKIYEEE